MSYAGIDPDNAEELSQYDHDNAEPTLSESTDNLLSFIRSKTYEEKKDPLVLAEIKAKIEEFEKEWIG
jgi:hypothetical protein